MTTAPTGTDPDPVRALPTVHGRVGSSRRVSDALVELTVVLPDDDITHRLEGGDEFVYVLVANGDGIDPAYTMSRFMERRADDPVIGAYYTVRRSRPGEIDLWAVDHGHGGVGDWIARARPGDRLALWGPRRGFVTPADARRVVLVADETGLAAVCALVEVLPAHVHATAVLAAGPTGRPPLPAHDGLEVVWTDRGDDAPGGGDGLVAAIAGLHDTPDAAFGAAESRRITAVRRHLQRRGVRADRMLMTGYWRRGSS
ncbi:MAG: siderophore-interacting protein [Acidimicrobiales bacterium]